MNSQKADDEKEGGDRSPLLKPVKPKNYQAKDLLSQKLVEPKTSPESGRRIANSLSFVRINSGIKQTANLYI